MLCSLRMYVLVFIVSLMTQIGTFTLLKESCNAHFLFDPLLLIKLF